MGNNFQTSDQVIIEVSNDNIFRLKGNAPGWFKHLYKDSIIENMELKLENKFPFIKNFLVDARSFWEKNSPGRINSGTWIEVDRNGEEYALNAFAVCDQKKRYLHVELLGSKSDAIRMMLQEARGNILNIEKVIKDKDRIITKLDAEAQDTHNLVMQTLIQLVGGIAHEFNNPLAGLKGGAEALKDNIYDFTTILKSKTANEKYDEEEFDYLLHEGIPSSLSAIISSSDRLRDLINDLHQFSQLGETDLTPLDLSRRIKVIVSQFTEKLDKHNITPYFDIEKKLKVKCFGEEITIVLIQLLMNAIYYVKLTDKDRRIMIKLKDLGDQVSFSILDNGRGIPKEHQNLVFQPFFTTKNIGEGVGLGLSVCLGIIVKHKGRIFVDDSREEGEESYKTKITFTINKLEDR